MPSKQDYPPLFREGLQLTTLDEVQVLCVDAFPNSMSRPRLMAGLRALVEMLAKDKIPADLWIDGSFVTRKLEPADVDVVLYVGEQTELTKAQGERLEWFSSKDDTHAAQMLSEYGCDCYFTQLRKHLVSYWMRQFGRDRGGNSK